MTPEEAIKVLRVILDPYDYPFGEKSKCYQYDLEAINKAIEALEKQIPKKPYDIVHCPLCKIEVELQPIDTEQVTYCLHCGQAIDWSDIND
jgi:hypothetical protein